MKSRVTTNKLSALDYPAAFPCPQRASYGVAITPYTTEMRMQNGWKRLRKANPYMYRTAQLGFRMSSTEFQAWHIFMKDNAFTWFRMKLQSEQTRILGSATLASEYIRFTSGVTFAYLDWDLVEASVAAEFFIDPDTTPPMLTPIVPPGLVPSPWMT